MSNVRSLRSHVLAPPERNPIPEAAPRLQLQPVRWGVRDEALARVVCRHLVEANPPTLIPFNPLTESRMRRTLRSLGIHH